MRKKKLLTKIGILLIGVVFLFQNCQKDFISQEFLELEKGKINILTESEIPQIIDYVNSYTNQKTKNSKTTQTSDIYTYLDVNEIMEVLDTINSTIHRNYSFKMINIDADPLTFYNLLVITDENTTQEPHIVKYVMNHDFAEQYFSNQVDLDAFQGTVQKIQISEFLENTSLNKTTTNPCEPIDLIGGGGSTGSDAGDYGDGGDTGDIGDGGDGDGGHYDTDCIRVSPSEVRCYTVWVPDYTQRMTADPCDPFGQNESGIGFNIPDFAESLSRECDKIKNLFIDNPSYKQKLISLATTVNQDHENAEGIYDDGTDFSMSGNSNQRFINLGDNPPHPFQSIAHTHFEFQSPTDTIQTYSVFSPGDLEYMYRRLKENELDNDFVAFLITGKGTSYAMTIHSKFKFKAFFKYVDTYIKWTNFQASTQEETDYYNNTISPIYEKYFDKATQPLAPIRTDNANNNEVLTEFLKFMDEANMGVTLFEVDANFENFERLKLINNGTQIERQNCNN